MYERASIMVKGVDEKGERISSRFDTVDYKITRPANLSPSTSADRVVVISLKDE